MNLKSVEDFYPLTPMQSGLLFHALASPGSGIYVEQARSTLEGNLDAEAFRRSWQQAVARHPVLRTSFVWEGVKEPVQVVHRKVEVPWEEQDLRDLTAVEQEARVEALLESGRARGFELGRAPLMRLALVRTGERSWRFLWSFHHLLLDGWSLSLLLKEVLLRYHRRDGGPGGPIEPVRPYRDFVAWLRRQDRSGAESFWRQYLAGFTAPTPLLVEEGPPAGFEPRGWNQVERRLSPTASRELELFARRHHLTLNTVLLGTWGLVLSRYSGQDDVVLGAVASGRPAELRGAESMLGLFINTVPVRLRFPPDQTALTWLDGLQRHQAELRSYEHTPLVDVQAWSEVPRGVPLFESIFVFENYPVAESLSHRRDGFEVRDVRLLERTNYALCVMAVPQPVLTLRIVYDRQRFDHGTVSRALSHWIRMLEALVADPGRAPHRLPLLTQPERRQVLDEFNATATEVPSGACIHHLFEAQAERTPGATAVVDAETSLTYEGLNVRANRLAHYLSALGVGPETLVGVCLDRSAEMVVGLLGILKAGGAYVPLDPAYPGRRLEFMLADSRALVVLTQETLRDRLPAADAPLVCLDGEARVIDAQRSDNPAAGAGPTHLAYTIYTSGSTGRPKGVAVTHRSAVALLSWAGRVFTAAELSGVLASTSICFDLSVFELFAPLAFGGKVLLAESALQLHGPAASGQPALLNTVPSVLREVLRQGPLPKSVRTVSLAGERLPTSLVEELHRQGVEKVYDLYGPSEDTTYSTCALRDPSGPATIGRPIASTQAYVLDRHLEPQPVGIAGELYLGGAGLARGYLHRPDLTAGAFLPNPFGDTPGERLYRTGDLACWLPDGNLRFLGRADHQVKIRGFRIELGEIESVLAGHERLREAVVLARHDEPSGARLVAYLVRHAGGDVPSVEALRGYLKQRLPEYMVPQAYVWLESLPRTTSGKVDRRALPRAEASRPELEKEYVPPRNATERELAAVWSEVLGLDRVGVHDDFFELGGHSLLATRLVARACDHFDGKLTVRDVFEGPTVAGLAKVIQRKPRPPAAATSDRSRPGDDRERASGHVRSDGLLSRIRAGELARIDAAAVTYLPSMLLDHPRLSRSVIVDELCGNRPLLYAVADMPLGRIGVITLPVFDTDLYTRTDRVVEAAAEAVGLAGSVGARAVSLTGLIPSATRRGAAVAEALKSVQPCPAVTTGHTTTAATVVLNLENLVATAGREMAGVRVGFLGLGSIGTSVLRLMLGRLPHPKEILLADVYDAEQHLRALAEEITGRFRFQGAVSIMVSRPQVHDDFYRANVVVGATNVADVLDVRRLLPGTVIVDDSAPHCFSVQAAQARLETRHDLLFTEAGALRAAVALDYTLGVPLPEGLAAKFEDVGFQPDPHRINGCILSALLVAQCENVVPSIGPTDEDACLVDYGVLGDLGFRAADLHCEDYTVPLKWIRRFRSLVESA